MRRQHSAGGKPGGERGAVTLLVTLILLVTMTVSTLLVSKSAVMEQRIAVNELAAVQAFEAAEAGAGLGLLHTDVSGADLSQTLVGTVGTGGSTYTVSFTPIADGYHRIVATGNSGDALALQQVTVENVFVPAMPHPPVAPITTRSLTQFSGSIEVINNIGNITIWSGDTVTAGGNAKTRIRVDGVDNVLSSTGSDFGPDVVASDPNLSSIGQAAFFYHFFGDSKVNVRAEADFHGFPDSTAAGKLIWHDGDLAITSNRILGSQTEPVICIIDGDLELHGNVLVNGVLYVTGSITKVNGNVTVNGGMVVEGALEMGNGNLTVRYDATVIENLGGIGNGANLPGSWRDWT